MTSKQEKGAGGTLARQTVRIDGRKRIDVEAGTLVFSRLVRNQEISTQKQTHNDIL